MSFSCGIVGLPNIGKSTIFNAITSTAKAQTANYPFCTIEPNSASVLIPDARLNTLANIVNTKSIVPATLKVVDIAGLIKNASSGEGLGNQFLENIRSVDAIMHVLRCFDNDDVMHVENSVDPIRDAEIIEMELIMSDMSYLEKIINNSSKKGSKDKFSPEKMELLNKMLECTKEGKPIISMELTEEEGEIMKKIHILTNKPVIYVANVDDNGFENNAHYKKVMQFAKDRNSEVIPICASIESEMIGFDDSEKMEMVKEIGFLDTGVNRLIESGYKILNRITYFTCGEKETRAWSVPRNSSAPQAGGAIHTDFERGFINAEIVAYDDFIEHNGYQGSKHEGKLQSCGKTYIVQEGDIINFKFNV
ncbi:redox-regulated ATPase YchF [Rickettsiales bacterium]|nr:redox-regulated ATPase YchF [Rickettsiales bacterium]